MAATKRNIVHLFADGEWHTAGEIATTLGVTRQTAHRHLRQLVNDDQLVVVGAGRGTRYRRRIEGFSRSFKTAGLDEALLWESLNQPGAIFDSSTQPAEPVLAYVFTELVNNVIDHSESSTVAVGAEVDGFDVTLRIDDEGVGIFNHIRDRLRLASEIEALQELSKGKTTTIPDRHTGEGIFFTSKAVHEFEIQSGTLRWLVDNRRDDTAVGELDPPVKGTRVRVELESDNVRDLTEVFEEFAEGSDFNKTRTIIKLFAIGTRFISRSEAKRLLHGLEKFREVVLDFKDVDLVGQGFADEVFRVWTRTHHETRFVPVNMSKPVEFMIERAIRRAEEK